MHLTANTVYRPQVVVEPMESTGHGQDFWYQVRVSIVTRNGRTVDQVCQGRTRTMARAAGLARAGVLLGMIEGAYLVNLCPTYRAALLPSSERSALPAIS